VPHVNPKGNYHRFDSERGAKKMFLWLFFISWATYFRNLPAIICWEAVNSGKPLCLLLLCVPHVNPKRKYHRFDSARGDTAHASHCLPACRVYQPATRRAKPDSVLFGRTDLGAVSWARVTAVEVSVIFPELRASSRTQ
jgi:hypothetical protein